MSSLPQRVALAVLVAVLAAPAPGSSQLLVPMDDAQENHLKAYGLAYRVLQAEERAEWLLNYRDGSFIVPDMPAVRRMARLDGRCRRAGRSGRHRPDPSRDRELEHGVGTP